MYNNKYKYKYNRKKNRYLSFQNESSDVKQNYLIIFVKIFFLYLVIHLIFKIRHTTHKEIINNNIHENYVENFINFTLTFSNDALISSILKNISIIGVKYSNSTNISNKTKIHICVNFNDEHIYIALVALESEMSNMNKEKSLYVYHILFPGDLSDENIYKLKNFSNKYKDNIELVFYNMSNIFIQFKNQKLSQVANYRLLLPIIIPYERIIYLDNDILVFKDLLEMYQVSFDNNYVLGSLDMLPDALDYLGVKSDRYINSGIILLNLDKIRNDNKHIELIKMALNYPKLRNFDQSIINFVFYPNISLLPFKFGMFNFQSELDIEKRYIKIIRQKLDTNELIKAFNDPAIIHLLVCHPKVWKKNPKFSKRVTVCAEKKNCDCSRYQKLWYEYAKNTSYYNEIKKLYK